MKRICLILAMVLFSAVTLAAQGKPNIAPMGKHILDYIVDPNSVVYSKTFSEYARNGSNGPIRFQRQITRFLTPRIAALARAARYGSWAANSAGMVIRRPATLPTSKALAQSRKAR